MTTENDPHNQLDAKWRREVEVAREMDDLRSTLQDLANKSENGINANKLVWWLMVTFAGIVITVVGSAFLILHDNYSELRTKEESDFQHMQNQHYDDVSKLYSAINEVKTDSFLTKKDVDNINKDINRIAGDTKEVKDLLKPGRH